MQNLNYRYYLLMVLPFMLAMCLVKNLRQRIYDKDIYLDSRIDFNTMCHKLGLFLLFHCRYLSPFSIVANIIQSIGLGIIFYYIFANGLKSSDTLPWFAPADRLPLFFGTAIFAIEGISVVRYCLNIQPLFHRKFLFQYYIGIYQNSNWSRHKSYVISLS